MKTTKFQGRIWVITDSNGHLVDDIDTDMIYHNAHLAVTDIAQMGQHAFGNLQGWEDFSTKIQAGDIILCGKNFGSGSSRQHAVDCFKALGAVALIAESFGAIYKRNAINAGFPIVTCPGLSEKIDSSNNPQTGQQVILDLEAGTLMDVQTNELILRVEPFNQVQQDIYQAGNLFEFGRTMD
jgi:3-isopropylmalate dehydratase small subunit